MGCVCSTRKAAERADQMPECGEIACARTPGRIGDSGEPRDANYAFSGELRPKSAGKVLGRAGIAGLEKAVDVLDSLGSSMSNLNLNHGSGFMSGLTARGNKISILAFEVANTIAKASSLLRTLSDENISYVKEHVLLLDGVRELVSADTRELMSIVSLDKREELNVFCGEVIRFGDLCKDPVWHNLGRYFQRMSMDLTPQEQHGEEVETTMQHLMNLAKNTSELYHELHALDRLEQDYRRRSREEESLPAARQESRMILHSDLKHQRKHVRNLKKKSLWSRNLEEVVEKLVDIVVFLHQKILDAFGIADINVVGRGIHEQTLGSSGLALHYANIIMKIDNIVSRPLSLPPNIRDTLYHGLPAVVKAVLRTRLQSSDATEEYTVAQIKASMEKSLRWMVPMAEHTIKAHQGFGWVGEWANICPEDNKKLAPQHNIVRIQTLHHANKEKTEDHMLELVVWLHHLVIQVKNRGFGFKALKPSRSRSQKDPLVHSLPNGSPDKTFRLSTEEKELLGRVSSKKIVYGRSKSQRMFSFQEKRRKDRFVSRSLGNSPTKFGTTLSMELERTKVLDILDGLDI